MAILTVGIDLAKNVFALYGVNEARVAATARRAHQAARTGDRLHDS